jgi:hypothetical protein
MRFVSKMRSGWFSFDNITVWQIQRSKLYGYPVWWPGLKNSPTVTHASLNRRLKWVHSAWGYSWADLSPGGHKCGGLVLQVGSWALDQQSSPVKRLLLRKPNRGSQGPILAVQSYDGDEIVLIMLLYSSRILFPKYHRKINSRKWWYDTRADFLNLGSTKDLKGSVRKLRPTADKRTSLLTSLCTRESQ